MWKEALKEDTKEMTLESVRLKNTESSLEIGSRKCKTNSHKINMQAWSKMFLQIWKLQLKIFGKILLNSIKVQLVYFKMKKMV